MSVLYTKICPIFYLPVKTVMKICASLVFVALMLVPCIIYLDHGSMSLKLVRNSNLTAKQMEMKTILYWTKMMNDKTFYLGEGEIFKDCRISACRATHQRNFMRIEDYDALFFHAMETRLSDLPTVRSTKQKYVFVSLESPGNYGLDDAYLPDEFYNWTMTYKRNSDIPRAYGYIIDSVTNEPAYPLWARTSAVSNDTVYDNLRFQGNYARFEGKRKIAAWFVSHCRTTSLRERYVAELQKYTDIDVYGACGPLSCSSSNNNIKCYQMLQSDYYFYIAFENSLCEDYVTEKLYKVMSYDIVPVVYGAVNYSEFAPPGSYINVADFSGPKDLAKYLQYLINNPDEYAKFFWWKKHFFVDLSHRVVLCQLCEMLHAEKSIAPTTPPNLRKWWSRRQCQNPSDFFKKISWN